jgi:antibiotic biosynthesis monooxygenase (ABM) superfamily enzyme
VRNPERNVDDGNDDDKCQQGQQRTDIVHVTFENLQTLNDWMTSPIRQRLLDELRPMLDSGDVVQLVANRRLPDAWTDLLVRQGEFVPRRPPPKWKVLWLTTCGLFLSVLILNRILPYYYEQWGIVDAHERLVAFLDALFATFFVSYIMQPVCCVVYVCVFINKGLSC